MTVNLGKAGCGKSDAISHSCVKNSASCGSTSLGFKGAHEVQNVKNSYKQCQTGTAGSSLEFLFKDGSNCSDSLETRLSGGLVGSCKPRESTTASCTGNGVGKECVWTIKIPTPAPVTKPVRAPVKRPARAPVPKPVSPPVHKPVSPPVHKPVSPPVYYHPHY